MAKDDIGGVWRTIGGRRVFIKDGQDLASAMKESGKFNNQKQQELKKAKEKMEELERELDEYEDDPDMNGSPAHDELRWKYEDAKAKYESLKNNTPLGSYSARMNKWMEENEYNLYKRAKEKPDSIDPMTENSIDWEALEKKYKEKYEREQDYKKYVNEKLNDDGYLRANRPNEYFQKQMKESGVKTFADEIKEKESRIKLSNQQETARHIKNATTQKSLKSMANAGYAKDITNNSFEANEVLREKHGRLERIKTIKGAYGINGAILRSRETGEYFVITARNSNIDYWI